MFLGSSPPRPTSSQLALGVVYMPHSSTLQSRETPTNTQVPSTSSPLLDYRVLFSPRPSSAQTRPLRSMQAAVQHERDATPLAASDGFSTSDGLGMPFVAYDGFASAGATTARRFSTPSGMGVCLAAAARDLATAAADARVKTHRVPPVAPNSLATAGGAQTPVVAAQGYSTTGAVNTPSVAPNGFATPGAGNASLVAPNGLATPGAVNTPLVVPTGFATPGAVGVAAVAFDRHSTTSGVRATAMPPDGISTPSGVRKPLVAPNGFAATSGAVAAPLVHDRRSAPSGARAHAVPPCGFPTATPLVAADGYLRAGAVSKPIVPTVPMRQVRGDLLGGTRTPVIPSRPLAPSYAPVGGSFSVAKPQALEREEKAFLTKAVWRPGQGLVECDEY